MMARSYFLVLCFILFMHACKCNARPIWLNIHHEMFPPHQIQEKFELNGNSRDSDTSKSKEKEEILHKKLNEAGTRDNSGGDEDWESWLHSAMIMNKTKLEDERVPLPQRKGRGKSSIFSDENLTVTDYEPPHRKSPIHN
ncbi:uncharacterized protein [Henckelia pumila]|uniref:uncharacterized protein n=1 Tax=Henckelia pumila TaxID=405737 RepID=UPI003C6E17A4